MKELLVGAAATAFVAVALLGCETPAGPGEPLEPGIHMEDPPEEPAPPQQPMEEPMDQDLPPMDEEPMEQPMDQDLPPRDEEPMEEPMDQDLPPIDEEPMEQPMDPDDVQAPADFEDLDDDDFGDPLEGFEDF